VLLYPKGIVVNHVPSFVAALDMFFAYGLMNIPCIFPVYKHGFYSNGFTSDNIDEYASSVRSFIEIWMDTRQVRKRYPHLFSE
jgi:hypothetical protein